MNGWTLIKGCRGVRGTACETVNSPSPKTTAYLALGSNLGTRARNLSEAIDGLREHPAIAVRRISPIYESPALTADPDEEQPSYLNVAAEVETTLSARDLLEVCQQLERRAGRDRRSGRRWEARTLDLDILVFGGHVIEEPGLTVPHPRMAERRFVLRPLADIAPDLRVPAPYEARVSDLLAAAPNAILPVRVAESLEEL